MNSDIFSHHQFLGLSDSAKWLFFVLNSCSNNGILDYNLDQINFSASPMRDKDYTPFLKELRNKGLICIGKRTAGRKSGKWVIGILALREKKLNTIGINWIDSEQREIVSKTFIPDRIGYIKVDIDKKRDDISTADIEGIFNEWVSVLRKDLKRTKLNTSRKNAIRKARKEYSQDEIIQAVRNIPLSEFHMGKNDSGTKYNELTTILKKVEFFRDLSE